VSAATEQIALTLQARQPYDFGLALRYFNRRAGELCDRAADGVYRRLFATAAGLALAELSEADGGALRLLVRAPDGEATDLAAAATTIEQTLRRTLGLDDPLEPLEAAVADDPALAALVRAQAGLRLVSTPEPFEAFVWAVAGQQISLHVAFRLKAALVRAYGRQALLNGEPYWTFPATETLAAVEPEQIAALGFGRRKAATIVATARAMHGGALDFAELERLPLDEAVAALVALHGVGPWTAHYTLLRGLRAADAFPASDMGLRVAVARLYGMPLKASVAEVEAAGERWRPCRGIAAFHLWFMLSHS
jgi:DNA-3-methyladenine glycosylase II